MVASIYESLKSYSLTVTDARQPNQNGALNRCLILSESKDLPVWYCRIKLTHR